MRWLILSELPQCGLPDVEPSLVVLIVEGVVDHAELIRLALRRRFDVHMERVDTADALRDALEAGHPDVAICDFRMPGFEPYAALAIVRDRRPDLPFIVVSGQMSEQEAVALMDAGVRDCIDKGHLSRLVPAIRRELRDARIRAERDHALEELAYSNELLQKKNAKLAQHYEAASRFVDHVSHEFRTPLTVIKEFASLIRDGVTGSSACCGLLRQAPRHGFADADGRRAQRAVHPAARGGAARRRRAAGRVRAPPTRRSRRAGAPSPRA